MRAVFLGLSGAASLGASFLLGLHLTFPDDVALQRLQWEIQDRSKGEWGLSAKDLDLWRLTGASLTDATLFHLPKTHVFHRNTDDSADTPPPVDVSPFLHADKLRARLEILALLRRGMMVAYDADMLGGSLSGEAGSVGDEERFKADGHDLDLSLFPMAGDGWSANLTGKAKLEADLTLNTVDVKKSAGKIALNIADLAIASGEFSGFKLEPMPFSDAVLSFEVENGVAKVSEGHFASDQLDATVTGEITLNKELKRSRMRLNVVLTLKDPLDKLARLAPGLAEARADDGTYHFVMAGTPGLARLRPDRLGARGTGGMGAGAGAGAGARMPGLADQDGGPDATDGASGDDDADARRQRRLERIRKARERRKQREAEGGVQGPGQDMGPNGPPFGRGPMGGDLPDEPRRGNRDPEQQQDNGPDEENGPTPQGPEEDPNAPAPDPNFDPIQDQ